MNKPVFGMLLGGFLGIFDGLSALVSAPQTRPEIVGIVIGSTIKGVVTGLLIGLFGRFGRKQPLLFHVTVEIGAGDGPGVALVLDEAMHDSDGAAGSLLLQLDRP